MKSIITAGIIFSAMMTFISCTSRPEPAEINTAPPIDTPIVAAQPETPQPSPSEELPAATPEPTPTYSEADVELLAKTVWGEARGCTAEEQRLVVWTVFQRVDADDWGDTNHPIPSSIYDLCAEELIAWQSGAEPPTHERYAPTLPYYFFEGDGLHNWFREDW